MSKRFFVIVILLGVLFSANSYAVKIGAWDLIGGQYSVFTQDNLTSYFTFHDRHRWETGSRAGFVINNTTSHTNRLRCNCTSQYFTFVKVTYNRLFGFSTVQELLTGVVCPAVGSGGGYTV